MDHVIVSDAFTTFANAATMKNLFQSELPHFSAGKLTILDCEILHTHYKFYLEAATWQRSFFIASYRLMVVDEQTQCQGEQLLYARAYLNGRSHTKFQQIDPAKLVPPRFGAAVAHLSSRDMIVWSFPNDPNLPHLPLAIDPQWVCQHLPIGLLPGGAPKVVNGGGNVQVNAQVVRYKPGKRCTLRYEVQRSEGSGPKVQFFGKMLADETISATYQQLTELWRHSLVESKAFGIAEPYGCDREHHLLWQAAVTGTSLLEALCEGNEQQLLASLAQGLADLHGSQLSPVSRREIGDELVRAQEHSDELCRAYPHFEAMLHKLMVEIEGTWPELSEEQMRPIHGDFHIKQLLVQGQRLFIFDFDDMSMSDPMHDLAFFIVDLHHRKLDPIRVSRVAARLCHFYKDATAAPLPIRRLTWHIQVQFVAKAYWLLKKRQQKESIQQAIMRTLQLAQAPLLWDTEESQQR